MEDVGLGQGLLAYLYSYIYIADHIECAQFHIYVELRNDLKNKVFQLVNKMANAIDIADLFTAIASSVVRLAFDYKLFDNVVNDLKYKKWALNVIYSGNRYFLVDEINRHRFL